MLTVQYPERHVKSLLDLRAIPLRSPGRPSSTRLDAVSDIRRVQAPTEVDHYQLRRVIDIYVRPPARTWAAWPTASTGSSPRTQIPEGVRVDLRGMVQGMRASFRSFGHRTCSWRWCCST